MLLYSAVYLSKTRIMKENGIADAYDLASFYVNFRNACWLHSNIAPFIRVIVSVFIDFTN